MSIEVIVKSPSDADVFGEGPHWDDVTQSLLWIDMTGNAVHRWDPLTGTDQAVKLTTKSVSLVVPRQSGGYVVTIGNQVCHLDWSTGTVISLTELSAGYSDVPVKFNDGKCDSRGRLWAGTFPSEAKSVLEMPPGCGYLVSVDGGVHKQAGDITLSNGMAWTADDRTMYFVDSIPSHILAFDFDVENGKISNRRVGYEFPKDSRQTLGVPDGMTIDTDGRLWVACMMAGKVICLDPNTGKTLRTIEFPVKGITSCCFGGKNLDELYVTTGRLAMLNEDENGRAPLPGSVFRVTGLGVKGYPANIYKS